MTNLTSDWCQYIADNCAVPVHSSAVSSPLSIALLCVAHSIPDSYVYIALYSHYHNQLNSLATNKPISRLQSRNTLNIACNWLGYTTEVTILISATVLLYIHFHKPLVTSLVILAIICMIIAIPAAKAQLCNAWCIHILPHLIQHKIPVSHTCTYR